MKRLFLYVLAFMLVSLSGNGIGNASLNDGLVAYYPFNSNANDESGTANNGIVNGATLSLDRFENQDSAYSFNGMNNFIEIPNAASLNPSAVTVATWFSIKDFLTGGSWCNNQWQILLFKKNSLGANFEYFVVAVGNGIDNVRGQITVGTASASGQQVGAYSSEIVEPNKWYHVAATITSEEIRLYVNGVLQDTRATGFPLDHGDRPLFFGRTGEWCEGYLNGSLDDVRIYNRALSESEIQELYTGIHLPVKPVPSVGEGDPFPGYGDFVSWRKGVPHNGIDYDSSLHDEVKSVGSGIVHRFTETDASSFGAIDPDKKGPAIWVRYKLATGAPIYVLYGHTATSWHDSSTGLGTKKFKFNVSYSIKWTACDKIQTGETVGFSAPFYHSGTNQEHLHFSVFKPKQMSDGTYYGPPSSGWGYSKLSLPTGDYIDPKTFFAEYYLSDDIEPCP